MNIPTALLYDQFPAAYYILILFSYLSTKGKRKINELQTLGRFPQQTSKLSSVLCTNEDGDQTQVQVQSLI